MDDIDKRKHPEFSGTEFAWQTMRDCFAGQTTVKAAKDRYLPPTPGMMADGFAPGMPGWRNYNDYIMRAIFPDLVRNSVQKTIGLLHSRPPAIQLPDSMKFLYENCTREGDTLDLFLRKINEEQVITGRCGILVDLPEEEKPFPEPYLSLYRAERIINWATTGDIDGSYRFIILDESGLMESGEYEWKEIRRYRILEIFEGVYRQRIITETDTGWTDEIRIPMVRNRTIGTIPFIFINSSDLAPSPDAPPLLPLAEINLAIYRSEADYRQTLFQLSQDTLVITGAEAPEGNFRMGAGSVLELPVGASAGFIGVNPTGIQEQREAIETLMREAEKYGYDLVDSGKHRGESGKALRIRVNSQIASLNQIARTGAQGLEDLLKMFASWARENPEDIIIEPNLQFVREQISGQDLNALANFRAMGGPVSLESLHRLIVDNGISSMSFAEELEKMQEEENIMPPGLGDIQRGDEDN